MLARILAFLSLLGLLALCLFIAGDLSAAHRIEQRPRWSSQQSASFPIHEGDEGAWDVRYEDVPGADGSGILWFRTNPYSVEIRDGTRILARVLPAEAATLPQGCLPREDGWILLGPDSDFGPAPRLDLRRLERIEYRIEYAGHELRNVDCSLFVCGGCDSLLGEAAMGLQIRASLAGLVLGVPLLGLFVFSFMALARRRAART